MVHPSAIEARAHVVMAAVRPSTPVLAPKIAGNVGLHGRDDHGHGAAMPRARVAGLLEVPR